MSELRVLTVRQPWAWAIIHGGKDVESRVRNIAGDYRGPVAIHVSKTYASGWESEPLARVMNSHPGVHDEPQPWRADQGAIIGVVDLVDVHLVANAHFHPICYDPARPHGLLDAAERGNGACSPWSTPDARWHLVFANARPLAEPIPYRGGPGLRRVDPIFGRGVLNEAAWTAGQEGKNDAW